jgi:hypothetical protein
LGIFSAILTLKTSIGFEVILALILAGVRVEGFDEMFKEEMSRVIMPNGPEEKPLLRVLSTILIPNEPELSLGFTWTPLEKACELVLVCGDTILNLRKLASCT